MKLLSLTLVFTLCTVIAFSQTTDLKKQLDDLNRAIDQAVVDKNINFLNQHYGEDFVFTHFTGVVDSKQSWIKNIENMGEAKFLKREHDSTTVELHNDVAIIYGKLSVVRESKETQSRYALWYVRVFARRKNVWQMISHRSTEEVKN